MANDLFPFCPDYMVPRTKPPQVQPAMSMNGWPFTSKPKVPYIRTFAVKLGGMRWYLNSLNGYDYETNPEYNAALLEKFYQDHGVWLQFDFPHPHLGVIACRFQQPLEVPEAIPNSGGLIDAFDIQLVEHSPSWPA